MLFMKNIPAWERGLRVGAGVILSGVGLYFFPASLTGYGLVATGVFAALTGVVGFCPACALAGRRLRQSR